MKNILLLCVLLITAFSVNAQVYNNDYADEPIIKTSRSFLKNYGDQRVARNILVVREIANFKMADEKLEKEFEKVEGNREFNRKMEIIQSRLSNAKLRNTKNKEAIRILNDAGEKLYKLLAN